MKKVKFGFQYIKKPTPKLYLRVGNSLVSVSTFISGYAFFNNHQIIGWVGIGTGALGTLITRMFTDQI